MPRSGMEVRAERVLRALTCGWWRGAPPTAGPARTAHSPFPGGDLYRRPPPRTANRKKIVRNRLPPTRMANRKKIVRNRLTPPHSPPGWQIVKKIVRNRLTHPQKPYVPTFTSYVEIKLRSCVYVLRWKTAIVSIEKYPRKRHTLRMMQKRSKS